MRQRFPIVLAAAGRWPGGDFGHNLPAFNWVKVDNKGTGSVDVALNANPTAGDKVDTLLTVPAGVCRVFNVGAPAALSGAPDDPTGSSSWPQELFLVSTAGTTVLLEIADHPIVDLVDLLTTQPPFGSTPAVTISGTLPAYAAPPAVTVSSGAITPNPQAGTDVTDSHTGAATATTCTLAAAAAKTTYITGFEVTGLGATAVGSIQVVVSGTITGSLTYTLPIPAGVTVAVSPLIVEFSRPIPASAVNTAIVVTVPSFGAGNTVASAVAHGFQL